jgi:hypothetical protein
MNVKLVRRSTEEGSLRVFENRQLRGIFTHKRDEMTGDNCIRVMRNFTLWQGGEMGRECSMKEEIRNYY